jgi:hypothetical protein
MKTKILYILSGLFLVTFITYANPPQKEKPATIGVYYFDGWSGKNPHADDPAHPWAKNAPTHLTKRFVEEFPEREPVWGWRNDSQEIMERQIDLAAENGVDFFLFCWYWKDNKGLININTIENLSLHKSMELYLKAKNKHKVKFALLVANHQGSEIIGTENWQEAVKFWAQYFKDPQYITADGKPLVVLFGTGDEALGNVELAAMQETAKKKDFEMAWLLQVVVAAQGINKVLPIQPTTMLFPVTPPVPKDISSGNLSMLPKPNGSVRNNNPISHC